MEYKIRSSIFWKNLKGVYDHADDWHLADKKIQSITKKNFGLIYIDTVFDDDIDHPYGSEFLFKIVNKEKFLWSRLKYEI